MHPGKSTPPVRALLIYLVAVFAGGALLAPWMHWLIHSIPALDAFTEAPFHRLVNRCVLLLALAGIYPLLKATGVPSRKETGLTWPPRFKSLSTGVLLGFLSLAIVAVIAVSFQARGLRDQTTADILERILKATLTAVVVGVMEELLFRGALFTTFRKAQGWVGALVTSSAIYALVHFFKQPPEPDQVNWLTGFATLGAMLHGFVDVKTLFPEFLTLLVAGMMLTLAFQRTGNLYFSIGLHAGWIFWLKFYRFMTYTEPDASPWFWGTRMLIDGWLAFFVLTPTLALLWLKGWPGKNRSRQD